MKIIYSGITDMGLKRKVNQDAIFMYTCKKTGAVLLAVCDGMGGHEKGEKASETLVEGLKSWAQNTLSQQTVRDFEKLMENLEGEIRNSNRLIFETYNQGAICGSTCVILLIAGDRYGVIHAGDSRIYRQKGMKLKLLIEDNTWENQRTVKEKYSKREIKKHPNFGKLIHAVGTRKNIELSLHTDCLTGGESFLLCSDGLYKYCPEIAFWKVLGSLTEKNIENSVNKLIENVYQKGAGDNVSVILAKCCKKRTETIH